jgi:hypothetical protein
MALSNVKWTDDYNPNLPAGTCRLARALAISEAWDQNGSSFVRKGAASGMSRSCRVLRKTVAKQTSLILKDCFPFHIAINESWSIPENSCRVDSSRGLLVPWLALKSLSSRPGVLDFYQILGTVLQFQCLALTIPFNRTFHRSCRSSSGRLRWEYSSYQRSP